MSDFVKAFSGLSDAGTSRPEEKFDFQGTDLVREAYDLGLFLELFSDSLSFDQFVNSGEVLAIYDIKSLYDEKVSTKELDELLHIHLSDLALDNNRAVRLEPGESGSELFVDLSSIEPDLTAGEQLKESQFEKSDTYQVIDDVNEVLNRTGKQYNFYVDRTDPDIDLVMYIKISRVNAARRSRFFNVFN
jgi:hypothetical protein